MDPRQKRILRAAFVKVRDEGPSDRLCGVCFNVWRTVRGADVPDAYRIVGQLAATWPELSPHAEQDERGLYSYPVNGMRTASGGLWKGEQRRLRISLINHILDHLDTYQE